MFYNVFLSDKSILKLIALRCFNTALACVQYLHMPGLSRLTVVSHEAKEEVPCDGLSTNAREYIYKNKPC